MTRHPGLTESLGRSLETGGTNSQAVLQGIWTHLQARRWPGDDQNDHRVRARTRTNSQAILQGIWTHLQAWRWPGDDRNDHRVRVGPGEPTQRICHERNSLFVLWHVVCVVFFCMIDFRNQTMGFWHRLGYHSLVSSLRHYTLICLQSWRYIWTILSWWWTTPWTPARPATSDEQSDHPEQRQETTTSCVTIESEDNHGHCSWVKHDKLNFTFMLVETKTGY